MVASIHYNVVLDVASRSLSCEQLCSLLPKSTQVVSGQWKGQRLANRVVQRNRIVISLGEGRVVHWKRATARLRAICASVAAKTPKGKRVDLNLRIGLMSSHYVTSMLVDPAMSVMCARLDVAIEITVYPTTES
ncbi:MAG: hypothetical protein AABZ53_06560 [Planctomycetota bacterium]